MAKPTINSEHVPVFTVHNKKPLNKTYTMFSKKERFGVRLPQTVRVWGTSTPKVKSKTHKTTHLKPTQCEDFRTYPSKDLILYRFTNLGRLTPTFYPNTEQTY